MVAGSAIWEPSLRGASPGVVLIDTYTASFLQ